MAPAEAARVASCESSFRAIVQSCAKLFDESLAIVMETDDPSGPHRARVALRRLTTALDAFGPILRRKPSAEIRSRAKKIFRLLGELRDSDVYLQTVAGGEAPGTTVDHLSGNHRLREKVRTKLRTLRAVCFGPLILRSAEEEDGLYRRSAKAKARRAGPVLTFAAQAISAAWSVCRSYGPSVKMISEPDRHDFRKDMKTLRYLAEFFSEHFPDQDNKPFLKDFRAVQDALGVINDFAVALEIEGRKPPKRLPTKVAEALERVETLWSRLYESPLPWSVQATLFP